MTWSYSGNPAASDLDRYRFLTGDTNELEPFLTDEEIEYLISQYKTEDLVLYNIYKNILVKVARYVTEKLGPEEVKKSDLWQHYKELLDKYTPLGMSSYPVMTSNQHEAIFDIDRIPHRECWET